MNVFITKHKGNALDGSIKPRNDLAKALNINTINVPYKEHVESIDSILKVLNGVDSLYFQYPIYNTGINVLKTIRETYPKLNIVGIIHDIDSIRFYGQEFSSNSPEFNDFLMMDTLIVGSERVKMQILSSGYTGSIIVHGMWANIPEDIETDGLPIVYAGNLSLEKSGFLINPKYENIIKKYVSIFGKINQGMGDVINYNYIGALNNEFLVKYIRNTRNFEYGLIWDEPFGVDHTSWSDYNALNMPAKLSMYIRAGIPVIVKSNTRAAEIVEKYKIGVIIDSIEDIENVINNNDIRYSMLANNVFDMSKYIKNGESFFMS